ncbi:helix-turn-helix transcriptional regulator [Bacillus altitudinis]|uniref:helix-turn-helix domain-containing protein n=1 Tax=Bacillus altitudinis TaxID=293387 RepID=UPI002F95873A
MTTIESLLRNSPYFRVFFKSYRKEMGVNARDLSRKLGKGDAYISQIESGRIKNVDESTARWLLNKIGTTQEEVDKIVYFYFYREPSHYNNEALHHRRESFSEELNTDPASNDLYKSLFELVDSMRPQATDEDLKRGAEILGRVNSINSTIKILIAADLEAADDLVSKLSELTAEVSFPIFNKKSEEHQKIAGVLLDAKNVIESAALKIQEKEESEKSK